MKVSERKNVKIIEDFKKRNYEEVFGKTFWI